MKITRLFLAILYGPYIKSLEGHETIKPFLVTISSTDTIGSTNLVHQRGLASNLSHLSISSTTNWHRQAIPKSNNFFNNILTKVY